MGGGKRETLSDPTPGRDELVEIFDEEPLEAKNPDGKKQGGLFTLQGKDPTLNSETRNPYLTQAKKFENDLAAQKYSGPWKPTQKMDATRPPKFCDTGAQRRPGSRKSREGPGATLTRLPCCLKGRR